MGLDSQNKTCIIITVFQPCPNLSNLVNAADDTPKENSFVIQDHCISTDVALTRKVVNIGQDSETT